MKNPSFGQSELKQILEYDPETGIFRNLVSRRKARAGDVPGNISPTGYLQMTVFGHHCYAHRLAWLYITGEWPEGCIDHINHDKLDNRIANLRAATHTDNARNRSMQSNNTSGAMGIMWCKQRLRWKAVIKADGAYKSIGRFKDWFDAVCARKSAENKYGFHQNHGASNA